MPKTLRVLHNPFLGLPREITINEVLTRFPTWQRQAVSLDGVSPVLYRSFDDLVFLLPDDWPERDAKEFERTRHLRAIVVELEDEEHDDIISSIDSRSVGNPAETIRNA